MTEPSDYSEYGYWHRQVTWNTNSFIYDLLTCMVLVQ